MKTVRLFLLFPLMLFSGLVFGQDEENFISRFQLYQTRKNLSLPEGESKMILHFNPSDFSVIPPGYEQVIYYALNKREDTLMLGPTFTDTLSFQAGPVVLQFWAGPGYEEIITDTIRFEAQTEYEAGIVFHPESIRVRVSKPVIYLQTPVEQTFTLQVHPAGTFSFTYPAYSGAWKGTVYPNGEIAINNQRYPYLFWDSEQAFQLEKEANGYHISQKEVIPFLENTLSHAGFTFAEKADFITYWGPRLTQFESVFIRFYAQEACNRFANLQCEPEPESTHRLYIAFSEWSETLTPYLGEIELPRFKRRGFHLLEWGGFEFKLPSL